VVSGQQHALAALFPRVTILQDGLDWRKSRLHRDSIPDRAARSQSLYRLSYPANTILYYGYEIIEDEERELQLELIK